ncbi:MAG: hypothetical protein ACRYHQ_30635, partial [Janthinobacterium lividum]
DRQHDAQTLATLIASGLLSTETAVKTLAGTYDVEDIPAELRRIAEAHTAPSTPPPGANPEAA